MALSLRFPEEGEFSSRAGVAPFESEEDAQASAPGAAIFRWSKAARIASPQLAADAPVSVARLIVAMPGAAQAFIEELTTYWAVVGTVLTTDQAVLPFKLGDAGKSACSILSSSPKIGEGSTLAVCLPQQVPVQSTWVWLNALRRHIDAEHTFCLDSQLSTIYEDQFAAPSEPFPLLRMLSTSSATQVRDAKLARPLPTPQFVTGLPAALLTHGELRKRSVSVFISLRDVATAHGDVVRSFAPLASLLGLELPQSLKSFVSTGPSASPEVNVLYT